MVPNMYSSPKFAKLNKWTPWRLCKNFEETGECDYGEICNYAHGKEELNTDAINAKAALEEIVKKNPAYRTSLCKSGVNCRCATLAKSSSVAK